MIQLLYVDDEPGLLEIGKMFLEESGHFCVETAISASEALALIQKCQYDAVISDYQMPGMDGITFLKQIRASGNTIPFIIFTGRSREEVVIQALNEGADFYLQKGGEPEAQFVELMHKVRIAVQRRKGEMELRDSKKELSDIFQFLPDAILAIDMHKQIIIWNKAIEDMTGIPAPEMIGKGNYAYTVPFYGEARPQLMDLVFENSPEVAALYPRIARHGNTLSIEVFCNALYNNQGAWVFAKASPLYDSSGTTIGAIEIIRDITAQKVSEEALRNSETKYRTLLQNANDAIILHELTRQGPGKILEVNEKACEIYGYTRDEFKTKSIPDLNNPNMDEELASMATQVLQNSQAVFEREHLGKNGRIIPVEVSVGKVDLEGSPCAIAIIHDNTERKKTLESLKASEVKYRNLVDNIHDIIWETTRDLRFTYISPAQERITGYSIEEIMGRSLLDIISPKSAEMVKDRLAHRLTEAASGTIGEGSVFEIEVQKKDGSLVWLEVSTTPIFDTGRSLTGFRGICHDITERKQADETLRETYQLLKTTFASLNDAIFVLDDMTTVVDCNPAASQIFGYSRDEMFGRTTAFLHVNDSALAGFRQHLHSAVEAKGSLDHFEFKMRRKDGTVFTTDHSVIPLEDAKGTRSGWVSVVRDITERKKAEEALQESESRFRALVETTPDNVWEMDNRGVFRYISPQSITIFGYQPEEMVGKSVIDFVPESARSSTRDTFARFNAAKEPFHTLEVTIRHRDGHDRVIEVHSIRIPGNDGNPVGQRGVCRDITGRKQAEEALQKANRQLNLLSSITRHDINNKMTVVLGYLSIAEDKSKDPALAEYFWKIQLALNAIQSQIAFMKVYQDLGSHELQWQDQDELLALLQVPVTISLKHDMTGVEVYADPMLEKVFFNLLDNSVRHGEHVTEITVSSIQSGDSLTIVWEDNGVGVPAAEKEKIFERGFGKNTGLGMFFIREVLLLTDITIKETGEPGNGARFEITVPKGAWRFTGSE